MLQWLKGKRTPQKGAAEGAVLSEALQAHDVQWCRDTSMPIPDWSGTAWPQAGEEHALHRYANGLAAAWLDATASALSERYTRAESANFMLLSALDPRSTRVLLDYLERSRRRVLTTLPGIDTLVPPGDPTAAGGADDRVIITSNGHRPAATCRDQPRQRFYVDYR